eukprot:comp17275_c0_seq1/m.16377 comp17275_c0_seq1/g.16377  ORF comp17275_c0_seq1/g.16377 comp17275_c0_seq1/m.16377 type:complete len:139 (-) comp17275_c0_seq1:42-458(-)
MASLISSDVQTRVSSTLNRDVKQYGKKFLLDGREDTCWNSDEGETQFVIMKFPKTARVSEVRIMFQGGFAGKECQILGSKGDDVWAKIADIYPEDVNSLQIFPVAATEVEQLQLLVTKSTDFFGRVVIYVLDVLGEYL